MNGKQVVKCFSNLSEAKVWKGDTSDSSLKDQTERLTFKEVKEMFLEKKKSEVKISTYEITFINLKLSVYFDEMKLIEITPKVIDSWLF